MPQELLRDVCRPGDAMGRSRRHWSVLPLSIAAHVLIFGAVLIIPLIAEIERPTPAPPSMNIRWVGPAVAPRVPAPRPPQSSSASSTAAPTTAPSSIVEAPDPVPPGSNAGEDVPGAVPTDAGVPFGIPGGGGEGVVWLPPPPPPAPPVQPHRVGNGVREPRKLVDVAPVYPAPARDARIQGIVMLEAVIDVDGRVDRIRVLRSVPMLDAAAIDAVKRWRYTPTLLNNVPVPVLMTITVSFTLR